jgi:hypothetical protein
MIQPVSSAFQVADSDVLKPPSRPGPITSGDAFIKTEDNINMRRAGLTLEEQAHQPTPKLIPLLNPLDTEMPDLSVSREIHLNLSLFG